MQMMLTNLRSWWNMLCDIGPQYGYFVNSAKTFLIVKEEHVVQAHSIFTDTGIQITTEGKRYLGSALGSPAFVESYVNGKVKEWSDELSKVCEFATSQPHAAFSALMDCLEDGFISPELCPIFLSHFPLWNKISVCISCPP